MSFSLHRDARTQHGSKRHESCPVKGAFELQHLHKRLCLFPGDYGELLWVSHDVAGFLFFYCKCGTTLSLSADQSQWFDVSSLLSQEAQAVYREIKNQIDLPVLDNAVMEVKRLLDDPDSSSEAIARSAKKDSNLAERIIQAADVIRPESSRPVTEIIQGINLLGRKKLSALLLQAGAEHRPFQSKLYTRLHYYKESWTNGLVAEVLARRFKTTTSPDFAYIDGSFANIGKLLGGLACGETMDKVHSWCNSLENCCPWTKAEEHLGIPSHVILGEIACAIWGIDERVKTVCLRHHGTEKQDSEADDATMLVRLAVQVSHLVDYNSHRVEESTLQAAARHFNVEGAVGELVSTTRGHVEAALRRMTLMNSRKAS